MLPIFICEDDKVQRSTLERYITNYIVMEELSMRITLSTGDPEAILEYLKQNPKTMGIYFLDVDLGHAINGIDLAVKIREIDPLGAIVFVTTHNGLAPTLFKHRVEALDYITKDNLPEDVQKEVVECLQTIQKRSMSSPFYDEVRFKVKIGSQTRLFPIADILFFETSNEQKKVIMHLKEGEVTFFGKLKEIEAFHPNFVFIHKSTVVNIAHIKSIGVNNDLTVYFTNGDQRPIATRLVKVLKMKLER